MMVSKGKLQDMRLLKTMLDIIAFHQVRGQHNEVEFHQKQVDRLQERIKTHNYKKEDEDWAIVDGMDKDWKKLSQGKI